MSKINRRSMLGLLGAAPLAAGFTWTEAEAASAAQAAQTARRPAGARPALFKPKFFTAHEYATVRVLADLIIPKDGRSGSATDAGVPEFMDFLMTDPTQDARSLERRQTSMRGGLAWIDAECHRRFGQDLVSSGADQQGSLLDEIAFSKDDEDDDDAQREPSEQRGVRLRHGPAFFNSFRDLTASGFWTSRMGVKDLGYLGNTATIWEGPPPEVLRKLGLDK
jgi:gluconate 2-dehydrogenase gamma chain